MAALPSCSVADHDLLHGRRPARSQWRRCSSSSVRMSWDTGPWIFRKAPRLPLPASPCGRPWRSPQNPAPLPGTLWPWPSRNPAGTRHVPGLLPAVRPGVWPGYFSRSVVARDGVIGRWSLRSCGFFQFPAAVIQIGLGFLLSGRRRRTGRHSAAPAARVVCARLSSMDPGTSA